MSAAASSSRERAASRVGQVLRGKWKLDRLLGVGGMASVYAATHRNGNRGAVKLLHPELSGTEAARSRFQREGYVANTVAHPGAVAVLDDDIADDGGVFLVMELLEGVNVDALLESRPDGRLEVGEVLAIADQLLDVLAAAHDKDIVHRDLKPENLFLTNAGALRVLDFGIARLRQPGGSMTTTRTGEAMGTPAFMPPEQALGDWDAVDARSDLWAAGASMFNLLSGRFVHDADNVQRMMLAAMTLPAPPLASVLAGVPPAVAEIVDRALAQRREDRWPDARTMQAAVRAARVRHPFDLKVAFPDVGTTLASGAMPRSDPRSGRPRETHLATAAPVSSDRDRPAARRRSTLIFAGVAGVVGLAAFAGWRVISGPVAAEGPGALASRAAAPPPASTTPSVSVSVTVASSTPVASATTSAFASADATASADAPPTSTAPRVRVSAPTTARKATAPPAKTGFDGRF